MNNTSAEATSTQAVAPSVAQAGAAATRERQSGQAAPTDASQQEATWSYSVEVRRGCERSSRDRNLR